MFQRLAHASDKHVRDIDHLWITTMATEPGSAARRREGTSAEVTTHPEGNDQHKRTRDETPAQDDYDLEAQKVDQRKRKGVE